MSSKMASKKSQVKKTSVCVDKIKTSKKSIKETLICVNCGKSFLNIYGFEFNDNTLYFCCAVDCDEVFKKKCAIRPHTQDLHSEYIQITERMHDIWRKSHKSINGYCFGCGIVMDIHNFHSNMARKMAGLNILDETLCSKCASKLNIKIENEKIVDDIINKAKNEAENKEILEILHNKKPIKSFTRCEYVIHEGKPYWYHQKIVVPPKLKEPVFILGESKYANYEADLTTSDEARQERSDRIERRLLKEAYEADEESETRKRNYKNKY